MKNLKAGQLLALINKNIRNFNFCYFFIISLPLLISFSFAAVNISLGFALFFFLLAKILNKDYSINKSALTIPFLLFFAVSALSMINSDYLSTSLGGLSKLLKYFLIIIMVIETFDSRKRLRNGVNFIAAGLFLSCANGLYQLVFGRDFFRNIPVVIDIGVPRATSSFPDANVFGLYLILTIPVILSASLYLFRRPGAKRVFYEIISIISLFCLYFTFSRGSAIGLFVGLILIAIIKRDKILIFFLSLLIVISPLLLPKIVFEWAGQTHSVLEFLVNADRINIYKSSLNMIKDHPIIGVGLNTFSKNYKKYKILETNATSYGHWMTSDTIYAHNSFLHMAGETGLLSLICFFYLIFVVIRTWAKFYKSSYLDAADELKILSLGFLAALAAFLVNGLTETNLYYPKISWLFWYSIAMIFALARVQKENEYK